MTIEKGGWYVQGSINVDIQFEENKAISSRKRLRWIFRKASHQSFDLDGVDAAPWEINPCMLLCYYKLQQLNFKTFFLAPLISRTFWTDLFGSVIPGQDKPLMKTGKVTSPIITLEIICFQSTLLFWGERKKKFRENSAQCRYWHLQSPRHLGFLFFSKSTWIVVVYGVRMSRRKREKRKFGRQQIWICNSSHACAWQPSIVGCRFPTFRQIVHAYHLPGSGNNSVGNDEDMRDATQVVDKSETVILANGTANK